MAVKALPIGDCACARGPDASVRHNRERAHHYLETVIVAGLAACGAITISCYVRRDALRKMVLWRYWRGAAQLRSPPRHKLRVWISLGCEPPRDDGKWERRREKQIPAARQGFGRKAASG
jgi:hypothetical protein